MKSRILLFMSLVFSITNCFSEGKSIFHLENGEVLSGYIKAFDSASQTYQLFTSDGRNLTIRQIDVNKILIDKKPVMSQNRHLIENTTIEIHSGLAKKKNEIGISAFFIEIESNNDFFSSNKDIVQEGWSGFYTYSLNDFIASRVIVYETNLIDGDDKSIANSRISGMEAQLFLTTNSNRNGWKFYAGGIVFGEIWDQKLIADDVRIPSSGSHSGLGFCYGIGYNFKSISLDFSGTIRQKSAYDIPNVKMVSSGGLLLAYRF